MQDKILSTPLIHYGSSRYKEELFRPITNDLFDKPSGGLWTSPVNSEYGWREWAKSADFKHYEDHESFQIMLKKTAKVLIIDKPKDLESIPQRKDIPEMQFFRYLDFENITNEYDAIYLTLNGLWRTKDYLQDSEHKLYSWDCESVIIMNKDCFTLL
ncbi:hypothetical protein J2810_004592 [Chryseobacterium rhizosphaerae]|uniref:hypothetical protein n=1 Tax=Chryseobacterium rhizosphaerae TaxID=395937 RepID=UPI00285E79BF|nr:hypothetical protein [Chryseobacterium rhizosphaerae]MDR6548502.1 hypothetical protein [Chryseobacterium rhizosphaerae]